MLHFMPWLPPSQHTAAQCDGLGPELVKEISLLIHNGGHLSNLFCFHLCHGAYYDISGVVVCLCVPVIMVHCAGASWTCTEKKQDILG